MPLYYNVVLGMAGGFGCLPLFRERFMKNKALIAISLVLVLALGLFLAISEAQSRRQAEHIAALQAQARPLEDQRQALSRELTRLENSYPLLSRGVATEELLFVDMDAAMLAEASALMEQYGFAGVLVLSEDNFPGDPDKLSREDFDALLAKGWTWCIGCDGSQEPDAFFAWMDTMLEAHSLSRPDTIFFSSDSFLEKWEEPIREQGFVTVVHHGDRSLPLVSTGVGEDVWYTGCLPWNFDGVKTEIQNLSKDCGNLCFEVSVKGDAAYNLWSFDTMLNYVTGFVEEDTLHVLTLPEARREHRQVEENLDQILAEYESQRTSLNEQIRDLDRQIQDIYARWDEG